MKKNEKIETLRKKIDHIDEMILELVTKRAHCIGDILAAKLALSNDDSNQVEIYDPAREQDIIDRIVILNKSPHSEQAISNIFRALIKESRDLQLAKVVDHQT